MADYSWPEPDSQGVLRKSYHRLDGAVKASGAAKYSSDENLPGMLHARVLTCPHAHARIERIDVEPARRMPGVRAVRVIQDAGSEVQWALDEIAVVAADTDEIARDAARAIVVEYQVLPHFVTEEDLAAAPDAKPGAEETVGDPDAGFAQAEVAIETRLGMPQIAHMCLEPHGQVAVWEGSELTVHISTQAVSTIPFQLAEPLGVPASSVRALCEYMGGGFGSKFGPERWGVEGARLAKDAGRPVKLFLERDQEVAVAGSRPSSFAKVRVGATSDGKLVAWESESWGSGGVPGTSAIPIPYVFTGIPHQRKKHVSVPTHMVGARAWRAPNHPQAAFVTMSALDDLAARLGMDPLELFRKNLDLAPESLRETYAEELEIAAELMRWKERWRPRGERQPGPVQRGLGLSIHTWGGRGHRSACEVTVQPDGSIEAKIGTQDLGTGTRTVIAMVLAETFGLEPHQVKVSVGDSRYPQSGPSGGSTTVGGVSAATRRGAQDALREVLAKVAPELGVTADQLEAVGGRVRVVGQASRSLSWREAAAKIGVVPITANGRNPGPPADLTNSGVGGVQMADVSVDLETGVVKINRLVAVQDCGLVINHKLAESQVFGGMIMGIGYALYEELVADPVTGRPLNANMELYKLASIADVGELQVHLMDTPRHQARGVIGIGEPPVISPGAAISNAVANAIGVRVPYLPITPRRVLDALAASSGKAS
ncbi:MAG TPA: xanthine dehydrogenase family protein molybdopterin-binding subunit [Thermoanaerobaculia bacterium]|nr:xanthine dehydrogenase family protein molybdopterin-binding subunit [Thermoanaerobaculia bacterium]